VLVGAVESRAPVAELANRVRVNVQTPVSTRALREEFAFLRRMMELTLFLALVTLRPETTLDLFLVRLSCGSRILRTTAELL